MDNENRSKVLPLSEQERVISIFCSVFFVGCESGNALSLRIITVSSSGPDLFLPAIGNKARTSLGIFPRQPFVSLPFGIFKI